MLQMRDWEVLRTLGRLRFMTTREVMYGFFGADRVARRRLDRLRGLGLVRTTREGVPDCISYRVKGPAN